MSIELTPQQKKAVLAAYNSITTTSRWLNELATTTVLANNCFISKNSAGTGGIVTLATERCGFEEANSAGEVAVDGPSIYGCMVPLATFVPPSEQVGTTAPVPWALTHNTAGMELAWQCVYPTVPCSAGGAVTNGDIWCGEKTPYTTPLDPQKQLNILINMCTEKYKGHWCGRTTELPD